MIDPFTSDLPKFHPKRLALKVAVLGVEATLKPFFERVALPYIRSDAIEDNEEDAYGDQLTATRAQRQLLAKLAVAHCNPSLAIVELGAWRGETTRFLAQETGFPVFAVDRYFEGWPLAEEAHAAFRNNTSALTNVSLIRSSTVDAARLYRGPQVGLLFIDAQHNYINVMADYNAWRPRLAPGGLVAIHDVDHPSMVGVRFAAWRLAKRHKLAARIANLVIVRVCDEAGA